MPRRHAGSRAAVRENLSRYDGGMTKDEWILAFANHLFLNLRSDLGAKFSRVIATNMWPSQKGMDPRKAAEQWAKRETK